MEKLNFVLDRKSLETIYLSFIRPLLEYSDVIWDNCSNAEKTELDKIQYEAARIATGATKLISIANLVKEIGWESLHERRRKHKLALLYKMTQNITPDYLSSLVPPSVSNESRYSLRNAENLKIPHARTTLYANSFLPSTVREWNLLPSELRNTDSLSYFKRSLNFNSFTVVPAYHYVGMRKSSAY